jgi:hypothetical protein
MVGESNASSPMVMGITVHGVCLLACVNQLKELVCWLKVYHYKFLLSGGEYVGAAGVTD